MEKLLSVKKIVVGNQQVKILRDISFEVKEKEIVSIVGESGCGKSMTLRTIIKLLPKNLEILSGEIYFDRIEIRKYNEMEKIRGKEIGMVFQEPSSYLNPLFTIGNQIEESIKENISKREKKEKIVNILKEIGLSPNVYYQYPHQLSGGMQQRAMIAMSLINKPKLLLADEPTTALDVTTAFGIINLLKNLISKYGLSIIFVTHDISLARYISDKIIVMYAGMILEKGNADLVYNKPLHPYTQKLITCLPEKYKKGEKIRTIEGEVPSFKNLPIGCPFSPRCEYRQKLCEEKIPEEIEVDNRIVRCIRYGNFMEN
ncbi:MAG: ABC transporter ATP-binding protein [Candidatus Omnitrophica bacterium]|nr:ABC transporter ATP-binding protein [Candidatus Omnitrophota bacterium]